MWNSDVIFTVDGHHEVLLLRALICVLKDVVPPITDFTVPKTRILSKPRC